MSRLITLSMLLMLSPAPAHPAIYEDFEDGDYTNNPTWHLEIDQGEAEIVSDPVRPDNLAYRVHGTATGNRSLYTELNNEVSWSTLEIGFDFMATDWGFHPQWDVATADLNYALGFGLWMDPSWDVVRLYPSEFRTRRMDLAVEIDPADLVLNTWNRLHTAADPITGQIATELRVLESGLLIASLSFEPAEPFGDLATPDTFWFGAEEVQWQHFDNIAVTPEPSAFLLLGIALLNTRRSSRHRHTAS